MNIILYDQLMWYQEVEEWIVFFFLGSFSYHSTLNLVLLYVVDRILLRVTMRDASLDLEADPTPPKLSLAWDEFISC